MAAPPALDSITSVVDAYNPASGGEDLGWTLAPPATRETARYGIRRPRRNTYASVIWSAAPYLPTDPTRVTPRKNCRRGACGACSHANDLLETKEALCGDVLQPVRGPREAAWVTNSYRRRDEMTDLLIDSDARDALIRRAYLDVANQSYQTESKPVLCKALARLFQHDSGKPLRPHPNWDNEDWRTYRWYCKNCYPYVSAAGSVMWYERPAIPKSWIDNVVRQLGPVYNYMGVTCGCCETGNCKMRGCPCTGESKEARVYPHVPPPQALPEGGLPQSASRKPTQQQLARRQRSMTRQFYGATQAQTNADVMQHYTGNWPPAVPGRPSVSNLCNCSSDVPAPASVPVGEAVKCPGSTYPSKWDRLHGLLPNNAEGDALRQEHARLVAQQRQRLADVNPDYGERVYEAQVDNHRSSSAQNQLRMTRFLDRSDWGASLPKGAY